MPFTLSQQEALKILDKNTIVSAGAGSGKTAVLTERIKRIIESGVSPLEILVLTFTKNAANEMKSRVKKAILADDKLAYLAPLVEQSDISTIDAFTIAICKKYFNILDLRPDANIIDQNVLDLVKKDIMDSIFESLYKEEDEDFLSYLKEFTTKDDTEIKNTIFNIASKIELIDDSLGFINSSYETYTSDEFYDKLKNDIMDFLKYKLSLIKDKLEFIRTPFSFSQKTIEDIDMSILKINNISTYDDVKDFVTTFKLPKKPNKKEGEVEEKFEEIRKNLSKGDFADIKPLVEYENMDSLIEALAVKKSYIRMYQKILKEFFIRIENYKEEHNVYTFGDLAKKALYLVRNNSDVREELKNKYKYILLDEYQDTSDFQEGLLYAISNNNMYMVGDIKQSIYRFRNANPDLFKTKYNTFSKRYTDEDPVKGTTMPSELGYRIDMIKNFRSRSEVLEDINTIFDPIMTNDYGDADYSKAHRMVYGNTDYSNHTFNYNHHMDILTYKVPTIDDDGNEIKFEFKNEEIEAFICARDILKKLSDNYMVYDRDLESKERKATYKDFAILIDRETSYDTYRKVFDYFGIPLSVNQDIDIAKDQTTYILSNMINLISLSCDRAFANTDYIHSFLSLARSFLFRMNDDEIFTIVKNKDMNNPISQIGLELNKLIDVESNSNIYLKALNRFNFFKKLSTTNDIVNKEHEAEYFYNTIVSLDSINYSFDKIASYFKETLDNDSKIKYKLDHSLENGVKLMNIHKSKGLEFPICYFVGLAVKPNLKDESEAVFDTTYGYLYKKMHEEEKDILNINSILTNYKLSKLRKSERLRLFYVGLTRAKEKMILITPDFTENSIISKDNCATFSDYLAYDYNETRVSSEFRSLGQYIKEVSLDSLKLTKEYDLKKNKTLDINFKATPKYQTMPQVSLVEKEKISKTVSHLKDKNDTYIMNLGTKVHEVMESLDFKNPKIDSLNLTNDIKDIVNNVLSNPLFSNIKDANTYHELEFSFDSNNIHYDGIIDLLAVYKDHVDIIDYKLSNVDSPEYKRQLSIYKEYVRTKTNLRIDCYLLSLTKNLAKKVEC